VNCLDTDSNDATFVRATMMIGGHDIVEEFLACRLYPLSSGFGFGFREVSDDTTAMSEVEMDAERVVESYGRKENEAYILVMLPNGGRLNRVFEQMGVAYAPRLEPGTKAFTTATKKRKAGSCVKTVVKKARMAPAKKVGMVKIIRPKIGAKGTSERELALAKPLGMAKKFFFSETFGPTLG
jgi:hypothetical protein